MSSAAAEAEWSQAEKSQRLYGGLSIAWEYWVEIWFFWHGMPLERSGGWGFSFGVMRLALDKLFRRSVGRIFPVRHDFVIELCKNATG